MWVPSFQVKHNGAELDFLSGLVTLRSGPTILYNGYRKKDLDLIKGPVTIIQMVQSFISVK